MNSLRIVSAVIALSGSFPAFAQDLVPTSQEIIDALLPTGMDGRKIKGARSVDLNQLDPSNGRRGIKVEDGKEIAWIDLRVAFAYDSDRLSNDAALTLQSLGKALASEQLKGSRFRIVGHTDAKGTEEYNQDLSERRAKAVTAYLAANYGIAPDRIEVTSKGESALIEGIDPEDERNRRVEVQNITDENQG